ncbi:Rrp15-like protein, partial [Thalictrum thalictroides]
VKLFNAVNKAQNAQKGLNPSRFKDAKALGKRRKEAFYSELRKKRSQAADGSMKGTASTGREDDGPAWAPLRDSYMLTNSKLKDWDKMLEKSVGGDDLGERMDQDSSSDED